MDLGGLDIWATVCRELFPVIDAGREVPNMLAERVARGDLGAKSGSGFADYSEEARTEFADALARLIDARDGSSGGR